MHVQVWRDPPAPTWIFHPQSQKRISSYIREPDPDGSSAKDEELGASTCESDIMPLNDEAKLKASLEPNMGNTKSDEGFPDLSIKPAGSSESPANCSTHQETPPAKKHNPKVATGSQMCGRRKKVKQTLLQKHQEILKYLIKHQPTKPVHLKLPAAERTDVLYESEVSHLESISTLPADIKSNKCLLLTVKLSSPGMVEARTRGKPPHLFPPSTKSHIYNTLVAWFLSLTGSNPGHTEDEVDPKVPFLVVGLQQLSTGNGLALRILVVARRHYISKKRDVDILAPFRYHVCRFLFETSLTEIAKWLPQLKDLQDQQPYASPIQLPSSCLSCFVSVSYSQMNIDRTFGVCPGFYWQSVKSQEHVFTGSETKQELHTEVSVVLCCSGFFQHPLITHYTLHLVLDSGLDVCGLRLLYPPQGLLSESVDGVPVNQRADEPCSPVLVLAVRGSYAQSLLKDLTSLLDPLLAKKGGKTSVDSLQYTHQQPPLVHSSQLASQVHSELCLWFSGRLPEGSAYDYSRHQNSVLPLSAKVKSSLINSSRSSSFLCATTKAGVLLVVSPVVPPCCYGLVLAVCERRGFSLKGLQRLQLQSPGAALLGLTNQQAAVFCSPPTTVLDQEELKLPSHCLVLFLGKENVLRHGLSLPSALMREFKAQKLLDCIHSRGDGVHTVETRLCFHTVPYNNNMHNIFVCCMWALPDPSCVILSHQKGLPCLDTEQVVILTLCGREMSQGLSLLHRVLTKGPEGDDHNTGLELLGLKWLPVLTRLQAQELSPFEVGEQLCSSSLDTLMSSPALVCALRGTFASLRKLLPHNDPHNLSVLMAPTPEVALRQTSLFFFNHELIPGRPMLLSVGLIKPRVWNHSVAEILSKLQQSGLTLVGLQIVTLDKSDTPSRLPAGSVQQLCSGSSVAFCLQGENAVKRLQAVLVQEDSSMWMTCYGSGSYQQAIQDVKQFFPEGLCCPETSIMRQEQIPSLCSDPLAFVERQQRCSLKMQEVLSTSEASRTNRGSLTDEALWQITCVFVPLNAPPHSQVHSQLEMAEQLLRSGCHLVAGRMSVLNQEQWNRIAQTLTVSAGGTDEMDFYTTPCLIMALQGEEIVANLRLILKSIYKERPDLENVGKMMIYPESEEEAKQLICYLFDALSPESCDTCVP